MDNYRKDLDEICKWLNKEAVEYMIIGGLAVNYHGFQRATGDIDIWYNPTQENFEKLMRAINGFGFETEEIEKVKYYELKGLIRLPLERYSIELLSIIDGKFTFESAYEKAEPLTVIEQTAKVMSYDFLIQNKLMARRPKDLEDIRQLEIRKQAQHKRDNN